MSPRQSKPHIIDTAPTDSSASTKPGKYSALVSAILSKFTPHFAPGSAIIHARDSRPNSFQKGLPDVVLHDSANNRLFLIDAISGNGPINSDRRAHLSQLFANATPCLIYVTAFPTRKSMARYALDLAWETEVWIADAPEHMIHLNGSRFLGPYSNPS